MRAVVLHEKEGPFKLETRRGPELEEDTVLLKVLGCGVCYRDLIDRKGAYPFSSFPIVLGHEIAGEVIAVGSGVSNVAVGDRVVTIHRPACGGCDACRTGEESRCDRSTFSYGMTRDGGYADEVLAHAASLVTLPHGVDPVSASFLHCTAAVALRAAWHRGGLRFGETVLVTGASGGVGVHALQLLRIAGARSIAVTTSSRKVDAIKKHGADEVIVLDEGTRLKDEVLRLTHGRGVDLALELVGKPTFNESVRSVRRGGRVVLVGNVTRERVELNPGYAILNEVSVIGSSGATRRDVEQVLGLVTAGKLTPVVAATLPLEERSAEQAHELLRTRGVTGRLVLVP